MTEKQWRDVPGFDGKYQASTDGVIRRRDGEQWRTVCPHTRATGENRRVMKIWLRGGDGKLHDWSVLSVVAMTWAPPPPGYLVVHRNDLFTENSIENIRYVKAEALPGLYANRARRRGVCKLDENGKMVKLYANAQQAAKAEYISYDTLLRQLNGKCKHPTTTGGVVCYIWEDQYDYSKEDAHG